MIHNTESNNNGNLFVRTHLKSSNLLTSKKAIISSSSSCVHNALIFSHKYEHDMCRNRNKFPLPILFLGKKTDSYYKDH